MAKRQRTAPAASVGRTGGALYGSVAALTDVGQNRKNNEDNLLIFDFHQKSALSPGAEVRVSFEQLGLLLAVADGMGGHSSGQVASQLCVDNLPVALLQLLGEGDSAAKDHGSALRRAVEVTNEAIFNASRKSAELEGMGTTLTAVWLMGSQAIVAQVGDSRAYLLHQGQLTQLTRDQTVLNSVSEIEREALLNTPFENMLLQAVGAMSHLEVAISTVELTPGDCLLLCSDGLYRVVTPEQITEILRRPDSLQEKARTLIAQANAGGGPDNVTTVLCRVGQGPVEPAG